MIEICPFLLPSSDASGLEVFEVFVYVYTAYYKVASIR